MSAQLVRIDPECVRAALEHVLAREGLPERPPEPGVLERWLHDLFSGIEVGDAVSAAVLLTPLVVVVAWLSWRLASALLAQRAHPPSDAQGAGAEPRRRQVAALLQRARRAEDGGELTAALRAYLFALVVGLGERGDLEFRPGWTNRELLARGRPRGDVRARLAALFDELDPKTFGRAPVEVEDVRRVAALCERWLPGAPA